MAQRGNPVYCTNCGSMVDSRDRFCGACGAQVSPDAPDAAPTERIPTIVSPPGAAATTHGGNGVMILAAAGAVLVVVLICAAIIAFNLLGDDSGQGIVDAQTTVQSQKNNPPDETSDEDASGQKTSTTPQESTRDRDDSGDTEESEDRGGDQTLGVGDSADVEGVMVTLNGVRTLPTTQMDEPLEDPDNTFIATDLTFENTTGDPVPVSSLLEFDLRDEDGYSAPESIHTQAREVPDGSVSPGQKVSGEIVYEVPEDFDGLQLNYTPALGVDSYNWEIGDQERISGPARSATGVEPSSVSASSTSPAAPDANGETVSYDAEYAVDDSQSSAWNVDGDGVGQSITLSYDDPVTVNGVGIVPGYDKVDPTDGTYRFYQLYVIKRAEITFSDGSSVEANFDRDPYMEYTYFPDTETDFIKITIKETYPPGDSPYGESYPYTLEKAAISEIDVGGPV